MTLNHIPLWARQTVYLLALVVMVPAIAFGWTTESLAWQIIAALGVALAPGLALANLADKPGRHRAN